MNCLYCKFSFSIFLITVVKIDSWNEDVGGRVLCHKVRDEMRFDRGISWELGVDSHMQRHCFVRESEQCLVDDGGLQTR